MNSKSLYLISINRPYGGYRIVKKELTEPELDEFYAETVSSGAKVIGIEKLKV